MQYETTVLAVVFTLSSFLTGDLPSDVPAQTSTSRSPILEQFSAEDWPADGGNMRLLRLGKNYFLVQLRIVGVLSTYGFEDLDATRPINIKESGDVGSHDYRYQLESLPDSQAANAYVKKHGDIFGEILYRDYKNDFVTGLKARLDLNLQGNGQNINDYNPKGEFIDSSGSFADTSARFQAVSTSAMNEFSFKILVANTGAALVTTLVTLPKMLNYVPIHQPADYLEFYRHITYFLAPSLSYPLAAGGAIFGPPFLTIYLMRKAPKASTELYRLSRDRPRLTIGGLAIASSLFAIGTTAACGLLLAHAVGY